MTAILIAGMAYPSPRFSSVPFDRLHLMNHFLALRLAPEVRDHLSALAERLQQWGLPAAWVHPEDLHITILFLGACDADEAHLLPTLIDEYAGSQRRPGLRLTGMGAFGGRQEPQVVFAAVADEAAACCHMHRDLAEVLSVEAERDYAPHITLCRPRPITARHGRPAQASWPNLLEAHGFADWGDCAAEALVLYCSRPYSPHGPRYHELAAWPLATA
jgi:2'-5' RNA ligase